MFDACASAEDDEGIAKNRLALAQKAQPPWSPALSIQREAGRFAAMSRTVAGDRRESPTLPFPMRPQRWAAQI